MSEQRLANSQTAAKVILSDYRTLSVMLSDFAQRNCIEAQTKGTAQKD
jgi:hypothetical protein